MRQKTKRTMCIKCWFVMMESSNVDCLSSLHSNLTSILKPKCSILNPPTSYLLYPASILHRHLLFLYFNRIFDSKCPQNTGISDKMSASAACTACNFFQVWLRVEKKIDKMEILRRLICRIMVSFIQVADWQ